MQRSGDIPSLEEHHPSLFRLSSTAQRTGRSCLLVEGKQVEVYDGVVQTGKIRHDLDQAARQVGVAWRVCDQADVISGREGGKLISKWNIDQMR